MNMATKPGNDNEREPTDWLLVFWYVLMMLIAGYSIFHIVKWGFWIVTH